MPKKLSTIGHATAEAIAARQPFTTHGALSADVESYVTPGRLNRTESDALYADQDAARAAGQRLYVVWSYATPIAWHSEATGWHRVSQRFSRTTTRHQGNLYLTGATR